MNPSLGSPELRVLVVAMACLLAACSEPELPPGFLDDPPPPPVSNTQVLSGGTLVTQATIEDAVVVLTDGKLVAWGKRGVVAMPNDSIGFDMRGHWITPGRWEQVVGGELPAQPALQPGEVVNLLIIKRAPPFEGPEEGDLAGRVVDGKLELFDA